MRRWSVLLLAIVASCVGGAASSQGVAILPPVDVPERAQTIAETVQSLGIEVYRLEPEQLVHPLAFNAELYPVAFYVGFERYVQTVREPGDGDQALVRYLKQGGTLVSMGRTWPFYRPLRARGGLLEVAGDPAGFCFRLGLPIAHGFEEPEGRLEFRRAADAPLLGFLPATMPFGASDARFRAAVEAGLPEGSRLRPILTLHNVDTGEELGAGVALIEHNGEALGRGKVIYVWGNMLTDELTRQMTEGILVYVFGGKLSEEQQRERRGLEQSRAALLERVGDLRGELAKLAEEGVEVVFLQRAVEGAAGSLEHVQKIIAVGRLKLARERVGQIEGELRLVAGRVRRLAEEAER
ncbi:MAG: hypothetical protein ACE5R4_05240 [Armatimonadota bacterium]